MELRHEDLCVWQHNGRWHAGWQPSDTLVATSRSQLEALSQRLSALQSAAPGSVACGLLNYHAGACLAGCAETTRSTAPMAIVHVYVHGHWCALEQDDIEPCLAPLAGSFDLRSGFDSAMSANDYTAAFLRIQEYLRAGDAYQVNFARAFEAKFSGDPLAAWLRLRRAHPAPHACFFQAGSHTVFGVSPERFMQVRDRTVVTEPIKGSRPRMADPSEDQKMVASLRESAKDRAENLMIVDLMRNDLGRICETGSVTTSALFEMRQFSNVHHLVSTIKGRLRESVTPLDALLQCFPGGSITGAPKKRAMEIIDELEPCPRDFYCGSQFSIDTEGGLDSNILIRTFQLSGNRLVCHGGGGIVVDSDAAEELRESEFKVAPLMASLGGH